MTFKEYLWSLLTRPFKLRAAKGMDTEIERWVNTLGAMQDDLKRTIFQMRRAWVPGTSWGEFLDLLGKSRGLRRYTDETDDAYRKRIESAFEIYQRGGTVPGILAGLTASGFPASSLIEQVPGRSWAEFGIRLGMQGDGHLRCSADYDKLEDMLFLTKAAHTMPVYMEVEHNYALDMYVGIAALPSAVRRISPAQAVQESRLPMVIGAVPVVARNKALHPAVRQNIDGIVVCAITLRRIGVRKIAARRDDSDGIR